MMEFEPKIVSVWSACAMLRLTDAMAVPTSIDNYSKCWWGNSRRSIRHTSTEVQVQAQDLVFDYRKSQYRIQKCKIIGCQ